MGTSESLTLEMKATTALIAVFIVFLLASLGLSFATGPVDIYAVGSLVFMIPFGALYYFCRKMKMWAYLATASLSVILAIVIPVSASYETWEQTTPALNALGNMALVLFALMALEGFKSYIQLKNRS